jgi:transcriptional regulator with XRE-family HTH domain
MTTVQKISKLCAINNTTPSRMMSDIGLTRAAFSAWKNGKQKASDSSIALIANHFNISTSDLLDDDTSEVAFAATISEKTSGTQKERIMLSIFRNATKEQQSRIIAAALDICDQ